MLFFSDLGSQCYKTIFSVVYYKCGLKTTTNGYFEVLSTVQMQTAQCVNSSSMWLLIWVAPGGEGPFYIRTGLSCCDVFGTVTKRDKDPVRTAQ